VAELAVGLMAPRAPVDAVERATLVEVGGRSSRVEQVVVAATVVVVAAVAAAAVVVVQLPGVLGCQASIRVSRRSPSSSSTSLHGCHVDRRTSAIRHDTLCFAGATGNIRGIGG
jgi:hypothetical protein